MFKHACAWGFVLCTASIANAGYTIDLILPPDYEPVGYYPGRLLRVDVALTAVDEPDVFARLITSISQQAIGA